MICFFSDKIMFLKYSCHLFLVEQCFLNFIMYEHHLGNLLKPGD